MAGHLEVDTDAAFNTSRAVSTDAEELREGLVELSHEWANVSRGWSGAAASAYTPLFQEWEEGASKLVEVASSRVVYESDLISGTGVS